MIYKIELDWDVVNAYIFVDCNGDINGDYYSLAFIQNCEPDVLIRKTIHIFECLLKKKGQGVLMTDNVKLKLAGSLALHDKAFFCNEVNEDSRVLMITKDGVICQ
jgi:hypothetical protein